MKHINQIVIFLSLLFTCFSHAMVPPLHEATLDGNLEGVRNLLDSGVAVNEALSSFFEEMTSLHLAVKESHTAIVELLLERGANPDVTDWRGQTPLHYAVEDSINKEIVSLLLAKGANPNLRDSCGCGPLDCALENEFPSLDIVRALIEWGANVNNTANDGSIPLHWAALHSSEYLVGLLLKKGADPKTTDKRGSTPLHWAVQKGNLIAIFLLIKAGAGINAVDNDGCTPLAIAQSMNRSEAEKFIRSFNLLLEERKEQMFAFLMATHPHRGAESPANIIYPDLSQHIWEFVKKLTKKEIGDFEEKPSTLDPLYTFQLL